ncbi:tripartite tricarboxylate transporter substrate binding protein [Alkalihalobacillus oceani]|uniref:Bug family tripartite tricarboxylate transporter substrate binding protein n=1 Tax=Halalkalibacter oceani TaxID=1653776 RepID=UPI0020420A10|nr:tripartite tricarboxylate transporter substrate binding protein [Halalkalibacter oceani]MCM3762983.1 tripartite tricarboxylate transporter substrate binding protein [Halalkalibacter oceani]
MKKSLLLLCFLLLFGISLAACGGEQQASGGEEAEGNNEGEAGQPLDYPTKPVEIIVPYDAGGGQDIAARTFAKHLEEELGQRVIVSNVSGGGGVMGHTQIANAEPDGYTLGIIHTFTSVDQFTLAEIPYTEKDFKPVAMIAADPLVLVAKKDIGVDNFEDFIEYVKGKPGEVTIGMGGPWNGHDFFRHKLETETGVEFERMLFQGGAPALTAVAGGNADSATPFVAEALAQIEADTVVPLAVSSDERSPLLPDIPTVKEFGYEVTQYMWRGFAVPANTPQEIVDYLDEAFTNTFNNPQYQEDAEKAGISLSFKNHEEFTTYAEEEFEAYKSVVEELGIEPQ